MLTSSRCKYPSRCGRRDYWIWVSVPVTRDCVTHHRKALETVSLPDCGQAPMLQPRRRPVSESEMRRPSPIALPDPSFPPSPSDLCSEPHFTPSSLSLNIRTYPYDHVTSHPHAPIYLVVKPHANYHCTAAALRRHGHSLLAVHQSYIRYLQ